MLKRNVMIGAAVAVMSCGAMVNTQALELLELQRVATVGERVSLVYEGGANTATVGKFIMRNTATLERLEAFCSDVAIALESPWLYTPIADPVGEGRKGAGDPEWRDGGWEAASALVSQVTFNANSVQMAGLQVAIWELLYDADGDLTAGRFSATSEVAGVIDAAQAYLALAGGTGNALWLAPVILPQSTEDPGYIIGGSQGLITQVPDGGVTLLLLGLGFSGLALFQNRARRRA